MVSWSFPRFADCNKMTSFFGEINSETQIIIIIIIIIIIEVRGYTTGISVYIVQMSLWIVNEDSYSALNCRSTALQ